MKMVVVIFDWIEIQEVHTLPSEVAITIVLLLRSFQIEPTTSMFQCVVSRSSLSRKETATNHSS
jgi:hypothetical protein